MEGVWLLRSHLSDEKAVLTLSSRRWSRDTSLRRVRSASGAPLFLATFADPVPTVLGAFCGALILYGK